MNTLSHAKKRFGSFAGPTILLLTTVLLAACASSPVAPSGAEEVRERLTDMQNDPDIANNARTELREAEEAVVLAEEPLAQDETALGEHRVYMADSKLEIARANAETRMSEADLVRLDAEREEQRAAQQRREANREQESRDDSAANRSRQQQIQALGAQETNRGLKLEDVLFEFGSADLSRDGTRNLDRLVTFLNGGQGAQEGNVLIEGHTDSVGSAAFNQELSQRRAEAVSSYLNDQGIQSSTLETSGYGLQRPVASNDSDSGRQQNRRVEVIIENEQSAQR